MSLDAPNERTPLLCCTALRCDALRCAYTTVQHSPAPLSTEPRLSEALLVLPPRLALERLSCGIIMISSCTAHCCH